MGVGVPYMQKIGLYASLGQIDVKVKQKSVEKKGDKNISITANS